MNTVRVIITQIAIIIVLVAGTVTATMALWDASQSLAEAETFLSAQAAWETDGRYHNPLRRQALLVSFAPSCGSCRIDLEGLSEVYRADILPVVGVSYRPYPDAPLTFDATVTGEQARRFQLLYGLTLDTVVLIDAEGIVLARKPPATSTATFYREMTEGGS